MKIFTRNKLFCVLIVFSIFWVLWLLLSLQALERLARKRAQSKGSFLGQLRRKLSKSARHLSATRESLSRRFEIDFASLHISKLTANHSHKQQNDGEKNFCGSGFMVLPEVDLPGGDKTSVKTKSVADCCAECERNADWCVAWTFVRSDGNCWMKDVLRKSNGNPLTTSGALTQKMKEMEEVSLRFHTTLNNVKNKRKYEELAKIWPIPLKMRRSGGPRKVSLSFQFSFVSSLTSVAEQKLLHVLSYYRKRVVSKEGCTRTETSPVTESTNSESPVALTNIAIECQSKSLDTSLSESPSPSAYILNVSSTRSEGFLLARSLKGCINGLESFAKICRCGQCDVSDFSLFDFAQYEYRGLMLDTGRRFVPLPTLKVIIRLMAVLHLNKLHLHLSDWAAVRWSSKEFPELRYGSSTESRIFRQYSRSEIKDLQDFSGRYGVLVIPEVDIPGHASSFRPLRKNVVFCDPSSREQLYNDPGGITLASLKKLISELADLFPQAPFLHIGGDETAVKGSCSLKSTRELQGMLQEYVASLSRDPMVWNEVFTSLHEARRNSIVQCWNNCNVKEIVAAGYRTIYSHMKHLYLDHVSGSCSLEGMISGQCLWIDIRQTLGADSDAGLFLGGEATMWTDEFCPRDICVGHGLNWGGHASWLYDREKDLEFHKVLLSTIFPRLALAAGSFWRYQKHLSTNDLLLSFRDVSQVLERVASLSSDEFGYLREANIEAIDADASLTCPVFCQHGCTMTHQCGVLWESVLA